MALPSPAAGLFWNACPPSNERPAARGTHSAAARCRRRRSRSPQPEGRDISGAPSRGSARRLPVPINPRRGGSPRWCCGGARPEHQTRPRRLRSQQGLSLAPVSPGARARGADGAPIVTAAAATEIRGGERSSPHPRRPARRQTHSIQPSHHFRQPPAPSFLPPRPPRPKLGWGGFSFQIKRPTVRTTPHVRAATRTTTNRMTTTTESLLLAAAASPPASLSSLLDTGGNGRDDGQALFSPRAAPRAARAGVHSCADRGGECDDDVDE